MSSVPRHCAAMLPDGPRYATAPATCHAGHRRRRTKLVVGQRPARVEQHAEGDRGVRTRMVKA